MLRIHSRSSKHQFYVFCFPDRRPKHLSSTLGASTLTSMRFHDIRKQILCKGYLQTRLGQQYYIATLIKIIDFFKMNLLINKNPLIFLHNVFDTILRLIIFVLFTNIDIEASVNKPPYKTSNLKQDSP